MRSGEIRPFPTLTTRNPFNPPPQYRNDHRQKKRAKIKPFKQHLKTMKTDKNTVAVVGTIALITAALAGAKVMLGWSLTWFQVFMPMSVFIVFIALCALALLMMRFIGSVSDKEPNNNPVCPHDLYRCSLYDSTSASSPCAICNRFKSKEDCSTNK